MVEHAIIKLDDDDGIYYPILVHWADRDEWFTEDGKLCDADRDPTLFWQPLEYEIPKKPKQREMKEKAWQWVCQNQNGSSFLTPGHYASREEVKRKYPMKGVLEPYLPSEIEREETKP